MPLCASSKNIPNNAVLWSKKKSHESGKCREKHRYGLKSDCFVHFFFISQMLPIHLLSIGLCLLAACTTAIEVSDTEELLHVFKDAAGTVDEEIFLLADLDFSQSNPLTLPLGAQADGSCVAYSGILHVNGHSLKRLVMDNKLYSELFSPVK